MKKKIIYAFYLLIAVIIVGVSLYLSVIYTPEIIGVVRDKETGKPIKDAKVSIGWHTVQPSVGGDVHSKHRTLIITTDAEGKYRIPKKFMLTYPCKPFSYISVLFYAHEYHYVSHKSEYRRSFSNIVPTGRIETEVTPVLEKIKSDTIFYKYLNELPVQMIWVGDDIPFLVEESKLFLKKYPKSRHVESVLLGLMQLYTDLRDFKNAFIQAELYIKKYPNSNAIPAIKLDIELFKRGMKESDR